MFMLCTLGRRSWTAKEVHGFETQLEFHASKYYEDVNEFAFEFYCLLLPAISFSYKKINDDCLSLDFYVRFLRTLQYLGSSMT